MYRKRLHSSFTFKKSLWEAEKLSLPNELMLNKIVCILLEKDYVKDTVVQHTH